jgi:HEAT repeat protein
MKGPGLPPLFQLLASNDPGRRMLAARSLVEAGDSAGPGLVETLQHKQPEVRQSVCWVLGELRWVAAFADVERIAKNDPDPVVRITANAALERLKK